MFCVAFYFTSKNQKSNIKLCARLGVISFNFFDDLKVKWLIFWGFEDHWFQVRGDVYPWTGWDTWCIIFIVKGFIVNVIEWAILRQSNYPNFLWRYGYNGTYISIYWLFWDQNFSAYCRDSNIQFQNTENCYKCPMK